MAKVVRRQSKDMAKFLDAGKKGRLLGPVERHVLSRPRDERAWQTLHPSEMSHGDWCPRAAWFIVTSPEPPSPEKLTRRKLSIFDEGHHIHNKWQTWFWEMGVLYGKWRCRVCQYEWWATSPEFCKNLTCRSTLIKYKEVPLEHGPWLINGHADGWIKGLGPDCLIELKSVGSGTVRMEAPTMFEQYGGDMEEIWRNLKRPFASHLKQALLYLEVLNASRDDAPQEVVFIYEAKFNQDAKEFTVPRNPALVRPLVRGAELVMEHIEKGTPPPCPWDGCSQCEKFKEK